MKHPLLILFVFCSIQQAVAQTSYVHPPGKFITVNGAKLWVEISGKGEPLFFLAGGPGNSHNYTHAWDTLRDNYTLVFIDNFGRGKSDTAAKLSGYSIDRDVEDVEGIRKALGYDKFSLLGHSYGSVVAQAYAVKYGVHLSHLIIANGFFSGKMWQENDDNSNRVLEEQSPELWDSLMTLRKKGLKSSDSLHYTVYFGFDIGLLYSYCPDYRRRLMLDRTYPNDFNIRLYYRYVGDDGDFVVGNEIAKFDVTSQLKDLKMPVLIIAGRYDRVSVPKFAVQYKKYCPQAKFVMFEHSGHWPHLEEHDKEMDVIRDFLKK